MFFVRYSALKFEGQRYSDLARQGCPPEPQLRPVTIYNVECTEFKPPLFKLSMNTVYYCVCLVRPICVKMLTLHVKIGAGNRQTDNW